MVLEFKDLKLIILLNIRGYAAASGRGGVIYRGGIHNL